MTAFPQPMVPAVDAYSDFPPDATRRSWDSYRPSMGVDSPSLSHAVERLSLGRPQGVNLLEAKQLYRQVYRSGMRDMLSPLELGHAAAYHAYRSSVRSRPVQGDIELERENLICLAIAEAARLNHQFSRGMDISAFTAASEAAARTACRIFTQACGTNDNEYNSRPGYTTNPYSNDSEDFEMIQRPASRSIRGRSLSRAPRPTFADSAAVISDMVPGQNDYSIPLNTSYPGAPMRYPPTPHPSSTRYSSMSQALPSYSPALPYNNPGTMVASYPRTPSSNPVLPQTYQAPSYNGSGSMIPLSRPRSVSFSSSQPAYTAPPIQSNYTSNIPYGYQASQPPQTIVIDKPRKHRHRHHHHHHRHRSRS